MENTALPGFCVRFKPRCTVVSMHPFAVAAVWLMLGIVAACHWPGQNGWKTWGVPLLGAIIMAVLVWRKPVAQTVMVFLASFLLGGWLCSMRINTLSVVMPDKTVKYEGIVSSLPVAKGNMRVYDVIVTRMENGKSLTKVRPFKVRMRVPQTSNGETLCPGDGIVVCSRLYPPSNDWQKGKNDFDYRLWMLGKGYSASTRVYEGNIAGARVDGTDLSPWDKTGIQCLRLRERLVCGVRHLGMSEESLSVVLAMSVGDKSGLNNDVRSVYSDAGVAHVLAPSSLPSTGQVRQCSVPVLWAGTLRISV